MENTVSVFCDIKDIGLKGDIERFYLVDGEGFCDETRHIDSVRAFTNVSIIGGYRKLVRTGEECYLPDGTPLWFIAHADEFLIMDIYDIRKIGWIIRESCKMVTPSVWNVKENAREQVRQVIEHKQNGVTDDRKLPDSTGGWSSVCVKAAPKRVWTILYNGSVWTLYADMHWEKRNIVIYNDKTGSHTGDGKPYFTRIYNISDNHDFVEYAKIIESFDNSDGRILDELGKELS